MDPSIPLLGNISAITVRRHHGKSAPVARYLRHFSCDDSLPDREKRQPRQLEMLEPKRDADDRDAVGEPPEDMPYTD